jgi:hypothetical protein
MTVVKSDTSVFVSLPIGFNWTLPPKILVRRRIKVDFPQPESAASPTTTTWEVSALQTVDKARLPVVDLDALLGEEISPTKLLFLEK